MKKLSVFFLQSNKSGHARNDLQSLTCTVTLRVWSTTTKLRWRWLSSSMRGFSGRFAELFSVYAFFLSFFVSFFHSFILFFFLQWRFARTYQIHPLGQDQSTVVEEAEKTVAESSPMSCVWARFPDRFPHYAWTAQSAHSDFNGSWVYTCLNVTCYLPFRKMAGVFYVPLQ